jgi:hypothetical protein
MAEFAESHLQIFRTNFAAVDPVWRDRDPMGGDAFSAQSIRHIVRQHDDRIGTPIGEIVSPI